MTPTAKGSEGSDQPTDADVVISRPRRTIMLAVGVSLFFVGGTLLGWFLLPPDIRALFRIEQILTLLLILAGLVLAPSWLAASSVRADARGLRIRNGPRVHRLDWADVAEVRLRPGDPWARAVLRVSDPESPRADHVMMMGLQAVDGERTRDRLGRIHRLHAAASAR